MVRTILPLAVFIVIAALLYAGLYLNPREIPSPLLNKPAPNFSLPQLHNPETQFSNLHLTGKVALVNAWASWCVSCRQEHHVLMEIAKQLPVYGINYKDMRGDALVYLQQAGNPYVISGHDLDGKVGIEWGIIATPESFVIDKRGVVRHKVTGPITAALWRDTLAPLIAELNKEPS